MVLSAAAVIFISTPESNAAATEALANTYNFVDTSEDDSTAKQLGSSLVNGLVLVSIICAATFLIVLLYKYRCMCCLIGYMVFASTLLLGFLAEQMFHVAIERYELPIDQFSFYFFMYNFAIVGVTSIFGGPFIVPTYMNQAYLIATSIVVAWHLSHLQPFLAWVLLVLLALYDLAAVLAPCGPLKALVNLLSQKDSPNMPGLLYEAALPTSTATAPTRQPQQQEEQQPRNSAREPTTNSRTQGGDTNLQRQASSQEENVASHSRLPELGHESGDATNNSCPAPRFSARSNSATEPISSQSRIEISPELQGESTEINAMVDHDESTDDSNVAESEQLEVAPLIASATSIDNDHREPEVSGVEAPRTAQLPFALAKAYKLRFLHDPQPPWMFATEAHTDDDPATPGTSETIEEAHTSAQLLQVVEVVFPRNGGRIVPTVSLDTSTANFYRTTESTDETRYTIIDSRGVHKRVVFVNEEGRIFEDLRKQNAAEDRKERSSIRLGLGDFIFYSILVSKAALYSFTTFAVCTLAVLSGLGLTLLLLAAYGAALPALPLSIALGVVFYLFTRFVMEPWVHAVFTERVYA